MYLATMLATHPFLRASPGFLVFLPPASGFGGCIDFVVISVRRQQQRCGCAVSVVCGVRCGRTRGPLGSWQRTEYNKGCALIEGAFRERLHEEYKATARRFLPRASRERERTRRGRAKRRKYTEKFFSRREGAAAKSARLRLSTRAYIGKWQMKKRGVPRGVPRNALLCS